MDDNVIKEIAENFGVEVRSVSNMLSIYEEVKQDIKGQYLAHLIRALEDRMRVLTKNPFFRIIVRPAYLDDIKAAISKASYKKGCYFFIGYPKDLSDKKKRVYISHELGHLYFLSRKKSFGIRRNDEQTEPLATIFGILAVLDKDEFYSSFADPDNSLFKDLLHSNLEEIIENFKGISHTSQKL